MLRTTRRRVLTFGLGGGALLLAGSGLRWFAFGYQLRPGEAAIGLSVKEFCVVRALVEAFFPATGGFPSGVELGVHQRVDEEVWAQPEWVRSDLRAALQLIEHSPPLFGRMSRLSRLEPAERVQIFEKLLASDQDALVQAAVALKQLTHLFYYGHAASWKAIGYDGPWMPRPIPPASSVRYRELLAKATGRTAEVQG